jgi:hypothetical protein|tara:strand:+ start:2139 stop:2852 length:714 start_codon:yes stop_codon:yes gene_type:complete
MEITLTESNSLKIISGNYTLVTNPVTKNNFNVGLFNNPNTLSNNNGNLIVNSPGEFEIGNFYITSIGYKKNTESEENTDQESQIIDTNEEPIQQSLIDFEEQKTQHIVSKKIDGENANHYAIYHLIQVEGIKILSVNDTEIPKSQKSRLSSENPKIILTPYNNINKIGNNEFQKLIDDIDYRVLIISNIQTEYNEEELYENSRITFGIKDKANLNKLNITPNNLPKEKRIVLLNQSK